VLLAIVIGLRVVQRCPGLIDLFEARAIAARSFFFETRLLEKSESSFRGLSNIEQRADSRNGILSHCRPALKTCAVIDGVALAPVRRKHDASTATAVVHRSARGD
jgi:hypothetical protein